MLLNLIRNPYSRLTAILLLICMAHTAGAQETEPCIISGPTTVNYGDVQTYTLPSHCGTAVGFGWTVTYGTILASTDSTVTIHFDNSSATTATISTFNDVASPLQVIVVSALGGGNIINQFQSPINYNTAPQALNTTPATGGSCGGAYQYQVLFAR